MSCREPNSGEGRRTRDVAHFAVLVVRAFRSTFLHERSGAAAGQLGLGTSP